MQDSRLVIFAHGSPDIRWRLPLEELTASLTERHGADKVRLAYMEFARPSLADVVREAALDGKLHLRVLPLFLAAGAHVAEDIPQQIADAQRSFPQVKIELLQPIGEHPRVKELFREIACDYVRD
ncbi:MAG: CbiX/SirB N-terminal domain-containing protein [Candidatus Acidiferrum sp.]